MLLLSLLIMRVKICPIYFTKIVFVQAASYYLQLFFMINHMES